MIGHHPCISMVGPIAKQIAKTFLALYGCIHDKEREKQIMIDNWRSLFYSSSFKSNGYEPWQHLLVKQSSLNGEIAEKASLTTRFFSVWIAGSFWIFLWNCLLLHTQYFHLQTNKFMLGGVHGSLWSLLGTLSLFPSALFPKRKDSLQKMYGVFLVPCREIEF